MIEGVSGHLAEILEDAAPLARAGLRRLDPDDVVTKAARDYQTAADRKVETRIAESLRNAFPDWRIEGEEFGLQQGGDPDAPLAVIDPIDGTTNYAWGIPHFGMVITVVQGGEIVSGAVMDPMMGEMFTADRGHGAMLNGLPLRVATEARPEHMLFGAGLPVPGQVVSVTEANYAQALARAMAISSGVRRLGSAALSIAYVAAGRFDGFFEDGLGIGDFGASVLMVEEAGGVVTDLAGQGVSRPAVMRAGIVAGSAAGQTWLRECLS
jgi:myo-inositol-1(or 4)-monophosphatase